VRRIGWPVKSTGCKIRILGVQLRKDRLDRKEGRLYTVQWCTAILTIQFAKYFDSLKIKF